MNYYLLGFFGNVIDIINGLKLENGQHWPASAMEH